jgi:hypothetical protein
MRLSTTAARRRGGIHTHGEEIGREPRPEDPLFFDPGTATPQFLSDESQEEVWKSLLQAAGDSGIDPALVHAMNKTGRIVTETNLQFLTDAELQEWNNAVDEYQQMFGSGDTQIATPLPRAHGIEHLPRHQLFQCGVDMSFQDLNKSQLAA